MPMYVDRHPSRDAALRDELGQLREQRGVSLDTFSHLLNSFVHSMCPAKMADQKALASLTVMDEEAFRLFGAWRKRVERWASGETEFPAWLEEAWAASLEELGATGVRALLVRRHGLLGVPIPKQGEPVNEMHKAIADFSIASGEVVSKSLSGDKDAQQAIENAIAILIGIRNQINAPELKAVG